MRVREAKILKRPKEIRSAVLHEKFGEHSTLIIVDENYDVHTLTGDDAVFHFLLQDAELPNFSHRRVSGGSVYEANRSDYCGYYQGSTIALDLIGRYRKRKDSPHKSAFSSPVEVWCENKYDFTDCTDYDDRKVYASDYAWLEVGKTYPATYWRDDRAIAKGCYRVRCEDGTEREAPDSYFRVLRQMDSSSDTAA